MVITLGGYRLDDDREHVDRDVLWEFLSREAYWARWRTREIIERQVASAWRVVAGYEADGGHMVGFARAVSDGYSLAYLADVFILADARGRGLGERLVRFMIDDGPGRDFRWMLHTADAHGLYERLGFRVPDHTYLERPRRIPTPEPAATPEPAGGAAPARPPTP